MPLTFALSPLLIIAVGAMLLMMAEAFQKKRRRDSGLALGAAIVFFAGAALAGAVGPSGAATPGTIARTSQPSKSS